MAIGLVLFVFLLVLLLVSLSPLEEWSLKEDAPLDEDHVMWPAAGYGSATVSLNCLFSAYSAALLLVGYFCFIGVVVGVLLGLFLLHSWTKRQRRPHELTSFQAYLYSLELADSVAFGRAFWFMVSGCQLGLAISELVLLEHVFKTGLNFSTPHALVATLCIALVGYYYCLIGGYRAVFRTDAVQFIFILLMASAMLSLTLSSGWQAEGDASLLQSPNLPRILLTLPALRMVWELSMGLALGLMPILAAPDAWKRTLILQNRRVRDLNAFDNSNETRRVSTESTVRAFLKIAPVKLALAASLPFGLMTPVLLQLSVDRSLGQWTFPLKALFQLSSPSVRVFLTLGMMAAFLSTFDGTLVSSMHILLKQRAFDNLGDSSELHRYRIMLGAGFVLIIIIFLHLASAAPHPYVAGAFLLGPFALVSGTLSGTSLATRRLRSTPFMYVCVVTISVWSLLFIYYILTPGIGDDPFLATPLVTAGCITYFAVTLLARLCSTRVSSAGKTRGRAKQL